MAGLTILIAALRRLPAPVLPVTARTFWGAPMTVVLPEAVSGELARFGFVEENLTVALLSYLRPGATFLDVGAHFGFFSLLAAHLVGAGGRVHAFEPVPGTFKVLRRNVSRHGVTAINAAVWHEPSEIEINDFGPGLSAFNSVRSPRCGNSGKATQRKSQLIRVRAITIDGYTAERYLRPDFVKIDVESAEFEVLQGMERVLRESRPVVSLEVGDYDVAGARPSSDLVEHMIARDYEAFEYAGGEFREHRIRSRYAYTNILFVPR